MSSNPNTASAAVLVLLFKNYSNAKIKKSSVLVITVTVELS